MSDFMRWDCDVEPMSWEEIRRLLQARYVRPRLPRMARTLVSPSFYAAHRRRYFAERLFRSLGLGSRSRRG